MVYVASTLGTGSEAGASELLYLRSGDFRADLADITSGSFIDSDGDDEDGEEQSGGGGMIERVQWIGTRRKVRWQGIWKAKRMMSISIQDLNGMVRDTIV